jgi:hypothetical protein
MVLVMVEMSPKVNMMTIKKVKPRVALSVSLYEGVCDLLEHDSVYPTSQCWTIEYMRPAHIARGMLISGLMASSAIEGNIPVAEKQ